MPDARRNSYGRSVVFAAFLAIFVLYAYRAVFAILKEPMQAENGWTGAQTSLGFSIMMTVYAVVAFISGMLLDRFGARLTFAIAAVFGALGFAATGGGHSLPLYFFAFGALGGICCGMIGVSSTISVRKWHIGNRYAKMYGIAYAGAPLGQLVLTFIIKSYLASHSEAGAWRVCAFALGGMTLALMLLAAFFTKKGPEHYGMRPIGEAFASEPEAKSPVQEEIWSLGGAFSSYPLWAGMFCFLFSMLAEFLIWTQIVSYWIADLKITPSTAANMYLIIGFCGIFTMPLLGILADKVVAWLGNEPKGRKTMLFGAPLVGAAAVALLLAQAAFASLAIGVAACVLFAIYWAVVPGCTAGYVGAIYGRRTLGRIWGLVVLLVMGSGPFIGSFLGGYLKDATGNYRASLMIAGGSFILSALFALSMPKRVRRPKEKPEKTAGA